MKTARSDYTLEFKQEAVRLVQGGQRQSEVGALLGVSGQTLHNWMKAAAAGRLSERQGVRVVSAEQMEISRLKAELARTRMERDILKKATAYFAKESQRDTPSSSSIGASGRLSTSAACWKSALATIGPGFWPISGPRSPPAIKPSAGRASGSSCARRVCAPARNGCAKSCGGVACGCAPGAALE